MSLEIDELHLEQIRVDIARKTQEMMFEPRKYRVTVIAVVVSALVGGLAAGGIIGGVAVTLSRPLTPQPIIIQVPR
jgi:hypothetical protein